ncbi:MAG: cytochrome c-type biogenesis protein [Gammaproteobacteria bacterium]
MTRLPCLMLLSVLALSAHAENFDIYEFESPEQEARFDALIAELRCPKCQNNNLADSNAPIAKDLRERTYELVREGHSDDEIIGHLKDRYGEFITYRPPVNAVTLLLWFGPLLLLLVVGGLVVRRLRRRASVAAGATAPPAGQVEDILRRYGEASRNDREPRP